LLLARGERSCFEKEPFRSQTRPAFSLPVTDRRPCSMMDAEIRRGVGVTEFRREGGWSVGLAVAVPSMNLPALIYCM
jgi:hypothetical protein